MKHRLQDGCDVVPPPPPGIRLHHVGVAVRDLADAQPVYERLFGYHLVAGPYEDPIQKVSVCFMGVGWDIQPLIELVAPLTAASPIANILAKGIGAYHVCYEVDEIHAALAQARANACVILAEPVPAVAFQGRSIAWLYLPSRQLVELLATR